MTVYLGVVIAKLSEASQTHAAFQPTFCCTLSLGASFLPSRSLIVPKSASGTEFCPGIFFVGYVGYTELNKTEASADAKRP